MKLVATSKIVLLEAMPHDRFICEFRNVHIQQQNVYEISVKFREVFDLAKAIKSMSIYQTIIKADVEKTHHNASRQRRVVATAITKT